MEVTYTLTMADIFRFNSYLIQHRPSQQLRIMTSLLLAPALWVAYWFSDTARAQQAPLGLGISLFVLCAWAAFLFWSTRRALIQRNAKIPGLKTARVYADGLFTSAELVEIKYRWPAITEMAEDARYLFLFIGPLNAVIIPKDAFGSAEQARAFLDHARACQVSVQQGTPAPVPQQDVTTWPPPPQTLRP